MAIHHLKQFHWISNMSHSSTCCEVDLIPRDFFKQSMTDVYTIPGKNSPIIKDFKLAAIKDNTLLLEMINTRLKYQIRKKIYFPSLFATEEITKAIDYLKLYK